jgi:carbonic anhydrase
MPLFDAIMDANHRALAGDATAGIRPGDFADALPVVALTCIDPRLNPLIPEVLGIPEEHFIWLRNAGNIITGPLSSTMRSLALACAVKGGREIAIIGHSDCLVCKTSMMQLTDRFRRLGIDRTKLPENLNEYFGLFASERQNVMKAVEFVRGSPLIGPRVPVHGLLVDIQSGRLEWTVNGYQALATAAGTAPEPMAAPGPLPSVALPEFKLGEMKFPTEQIGGNAFDPQKWLAQVQTMSPSLEMAEPPPLTDPPPTKRKYEPRPPTIPLPKPEKTPPKLHQPWKGKPAR